MTRDDNSRTFCTDCNAPFSNGLFLRSEKKHRCSTNECNALLCTKCIKSHPLIVAENEHTISNGIVECFCESCFRRLSVIDFDRNYDVIGPNEGDDECSGVTFVFGHGGGGSRAMFRSHAEILYERHGHESILFDFPGHGSLSDVPLTLDSCEEIFGKLIHDRGIVSAREAAKMGKKTIYVGGSFGAYVGFHLLSKFKRFFSGAIMMDCGQNVGPGASVKARLGLFFLSNMGRLCSNRRLMNFMLKTTKKSKADFKLIETCFGAGMFFDQAKAQVDCLKEVSPADCIPTFPFPVLFMNGSEDYRDSEDRWLGFCAIKHGSELKVYDGGDHFFMHDTRFIIDILQRCNEFAHVAKAVS